MPNPYLTTDEELTSVADAIMAKGGTTEQLEYPAGFISAIENISTGIEEKDVNFYDYDGTLLYSYTKADALALTALPDNPSHEGLVAQGWNWTLNDITNYFTSSPNAVISIGQLYTTEYGQTNLHVTIPNDMKTITIYYYQTNSNGVAVNFGDNTSAQTYSSSGQASVQHTYSEAGDYVIQLTRQSGTYYLGDLNNGGGLFCSTQNSLRSAQSILKRVDFGAYMVGLSSGALRYSYNLETIAVNSAAIEFYSSCISYCHKLKAFTFPTGTIRINSSMLYQDSSLETICFPCVLTLSSYNGMTLCGSDYSLKHVAIPYGITSIGISAFDSNRQLKSVSIPTTVTTVSEGAFSDCFVMTDYHFPTSITSFGEGAISANTCITSMTFASGLVTIGTGTMINCYCVRSITVPSTVTTIGSNAFKNCYSIREYHFQPTTPPTLGNTAALTVGTGVVIYVPYSADHSVLTAYQTAWPDFTSYMQEEPAS